MWGSYQIARVAGIPIRVHVSLVLLLLLLAWQYGPAVGLPLAVGLLTSVVLHELGHSLVAVRKGCHVRDILLMPIGGAARLDRMPTRPLDEFLMAIAGPAVSLVLFLALVFGGCYVPLPDTGVTPGEPVNILVLVGWVNLALALFNLLPAFPMDGGRVPRAMLTPRLGRLRATRLAAWIGRGMAVLFAYYAVHDWPHRVLLLVIAVFVFVVAGSEYRRVRSEELEKQRFLRMWGLAPEQDADGTAIVGPPPDRTEDSADADLHALRGPPHENAGDRTS